MPEAEVSRFTVIVHFVERDDGTLGQLISFENRGVPDELVTAVLRKIVRYREDRHGAEFRKSLGE